MAGGMPGGGHPAYSRLGIRQGSAGQASRIGTRTPRSAATRSAMS